MRFAVVIEKAEGNYSAYVPDLPGCVATADTVADVEREIRDTIRSHIDRLHEDGRSRPAGQHSIMVTLELKSCGLFSQSPNACSFAIGHAKEIVVSFIAIRIL